MDPRLVSIGMPLFNGELHMRRALASVLAQDYRHIEVIISDNASTDRTREIALEYAARDDRIRVMTEARNRGPWWNFHHVLHLARGEYFIWAAHDDFRDANYVTTLVASLDSNPHAALSCACFAKVTIEGEVKSRHPFPSDRPSRPLARTILLMKRAQSAWIYGLFRTASLRSAFHRLPEAPSPWGLDCLLILGFLLDEALVGTNDTTFYQAKSGLSASLYKPSGIAAAMRLRSLLWGAAFTTLRGCRLPLRRKLALVPFLVWYVEKNVFGWSRRLLPRRGLEAARVVRRIWRQLTRS